MGGEQGQGWSAEEPKAQAKCATLPVPPDCLLACLPAWAHPVAPPASWAVQVFHGIDGGYHELLLGPGSEARAQQVANWVLQHAGQSRM